MGTPTSVKNYNSLSASAPVLHGNPGSMITLLDAVLVNGYGQKTLDALIVASNVATCTVSAGHGFSSNQVVTVAGATPSGLNGDVRITVLSATVFRFATTGISDQTATGTITAKIAPLGWTKPFSGTNLAAYKPSDPQATGMILRVDDTGILTARHSRVFAVESMTDINTYTSMIPTTAQQSGGMWWGKSASLDTTARAWFIIGDERCFYIGMAPHPTNPINGNQIYFAGDILPMGSTDQYHFLISGATSDITSYGSGVITNCMSSGGAGGLNSGYLARFNSQLGGSVTANRAGLMFGWGSAYSGDSGYSASALPTFPNPTDGAVMVTPVVILEATGTNKGLRGWCPGMYHMPVAGSNTAYNHLDPVTGVDTLPGKTFVAMRTGNPAQVQYAGITLFDLFGPWR
ncbi:hypothetical protein [Cupriavidus sp. IK-TO18]|uniref:hypothetical protein n=1 Tax=Cupriavidus sp. IK-TO18 TaxID=2782182 RepID=UPI00189BE3C0|nr:hypothetical protein [Cupriavidus sp. IK-TO18]MBF6987259.1 hypothetical protein [Cupriavidus sp. IK-TO18]